MSAQQIEIGRGARRTYKLVLNGGGWWSLRELAGELELSSLNSLDKQLKALRAHEHIERRGQGGLSDPYTYGVTAKCKPMPGIELDNTTHEGANT